MLAVLTLIDTAYDMGPGSVAFWFEVPLLGCFCIMFSDLNVSDYCLDVCIMFPNVPFFWESNHVCEMTRNQRVFYAALNPMS